MRRYGQENPLYEHYDRLLDIAREYDVTLSLGDGLRPGCLADATDRAQLHELKVLGELTRRAWAKASRSWWKGRGTCRSGHQEKCPPPAEILRPRPFYVLGPLVTDVASGYDHIAGAIGGALAATLGASLSVLRHPGRAPQTAGSGGRHRRGGGLQDRGPRRRHRPGPARGRGLGFKDVPGPPGPGLGHPDQLSINPAKARRYRDLSQAKEDQCTMCGRFCAMKVFDDRFE
jgi:phosphomethylpyrimidine synthase